MDRITFFIEKGGRLLDSGKKFPSQAKLEDVIQQIVSKVNRVVNEASPIVDVRLLDGSRVNVVLPPVALDGPVMTIRRFPENPFDMDKLLELGSITKRGSRVFADTGRGEIQHFHQWWHRIRQNHLSQCIVKLYSIHRAYCDN